MTQDKWNVINHCSGLGWWWRCEGGIQSRKLQASREQQTIRSSILICRWKKNLPWLSAHQLFAHAELTSWDHVYLELGHEAAAEEIKENLKLLHCHRARSMINYPLIATKTVYRASFFPQKFTTQSNHTRIMKPFECNCKVKVPQDVSETLIYWLSALLGAMMIITL